MLLCVYFEYSAISSGILVRSDISADKSDSRSSCDVHVGRGWVVVIYDGGFSSHMCIVGPNTGF